MKKIIALLLALAMIFAFAACKGKDDNKDTTADSTQGAGADVQDTQAGGEDTTAAEAPSGDSTEAPSEGGSEAATQGQQGGTQGSADINAPVNGKKDDIVAFFNKYATAMKQYKGKVTVKRVQGTTSKINSITGGSAIANIAQPLLPNDYPKTATQTFNGGKAADGKHRRERACKRACESVHVCSPLYVLNLIKS